MAALKASGIMGAATARGCVAGGAGTDCTTTACPSTVTVMGGWVAGITGPGVTGGAGPKKKSDSFQFRWL